MLTRRFVLTAVVAIVLCFVAADHPLSKSSSGEGLSPTHLRFGAFDETQPVGPGFTSTIHPSETTLEDGAVQSVYALPGGAVLTTTTPPTGFDPLTASDAQLSEVAFPPRPASDPDLADWTNAMSAYSSDDPPNGDLSVETPASSGVAFTTYYRSWSGYLAGPIYTQGHLYVAVKGVYPVPTNLSTCDGNDVESFWIGMGGTSSGRTNDLVQQGMECGDSALGTGSVYRPFTEFANTKDPINFCGYTTWTPSHGHVIYQNMSFQTSSNTAYFYMEDETAGVAHSCSMTAPSGWAWNLDTAEWIAEAPLGEAVEFSAVDFSDTQAELDSNSTWVKLGTQTVSKTVDGVSSTLYCVSPAAIGSDQESFTENWHQRDCA